jgi:hypothetical protein
LGSTRYAPRTPATTAGCSPGCSARWSSAHRPVVEALELLGLRRREIWVVGANRWRDPESDLPADFEANREVHYSALRQPLDPTAFIDELRGRMRSALADLDHAVGADRVSDRNVGPIRSIQQG